MSIQYPLYKRLAVTVDAYHNCVKSNNSFAENNHEELITLLVNHYMPHGSGIDAGMILDLDSSTGNKLVFTFSYHFMNENGYYAGWEDYKLIVIPSLIGNFDIRVTGKNRDDIKDYFYQTFEYALNEITNVDFRDGKFVLA